MAVISCGYICWLYLVVTSCGYIWWVAAFQEQSGFDEFTPRKKKRAHVATKRVGIIVQYSIVKGLDQLSQPHLSQTSCTRGLQAHKYF